MQNTSAIDNARERRESTYIYVGLFTGQRQDLVTSNLWKSAPYRGGEIHTLTPQKKQRAHTHTHTHWTKLKRYKRLCLLTVSFNLAFLLP